MIDNNGIWKAVMYRAEPATPGYEAITDGNSAIFLEDITAGIIVALRQTLEGQCPATQYLNAHEPGSDLVSAA